MRTLVSILAFMLCISSASFGADDSKVWTSVSGAQIEAEFEGMTVDTVSLRKTNGKLVRIALNKLSREDQIRARELAMAASGIKQGNSEEKVIPPHLESLFGKSLVNRKKNKVSVAELEGKKIGIYFSAHWCPPCRGFTPKLVDFYNDLQKDEEPFEIVLVSSDRSKSDMYNYMKESEMPWLAVQHGNSHVRKLKEKYGIRGIPTLIVIDENGKTVSKQARGEVASMGTKAYSKWN